VIAAVPVELTDAALASDVLDGLALVEDRLRESAQAYNEVLAVSSIHLMEAGGKRIRPTLVLLAAQFGNPRDPRVVPAAVALELTHLATLYHDDVMDEANVRRGSDSANSRWGNSVAILTGDFLFARASQILADLGPDAVRIQAETFTRLVTGQVAETVGCQPGQDPLDHYLGVINDKTASLLATSGFFTTSQLNSLGNLSKWAFLPAFAGVGLRTKLSDLINQGWRPILVGVLGEIFIALVTLGMVFAVYHHGGMK